MNRVLITDGERFERAWPDAAAHLHAAHLRYEAFTIGRIVESGRASWQQRRLAELMSAPACRESWFIEQMRREHRGSEPSIF